VDGDLSSLNTIASSLLQLQSVYGVIPNIKSKGVGAKKVLQKLFRMRLKQEEEGIDPTTKNSDSSSNAHASFSFHQPDASGFGESQHFEQGGHQRSEIDTLIVIDREVDLVSPLVTPLTYEGLLDELLGIENGGIKLAASVLGDDKEEPIMALKPMDLGLNPSATTALSTSALEKAAATGPLMMSSVTGKTP
jgi:hypothetical protein